MFDRIKKFFIRAKQNTISALNQVAVFGQNLGTSKFIRTYAKSVYVYAVVRKRAEKVGQVKFTMTNKRTGEQIPEEDSLTLQLLNNPNNLQSKSEFFELYQIYKDLTGETYVWIAQEDDKNVELFNLSPEWLEKIIVDKDTNDIKAYRFRFPNGKSETLPAEQVIVSYYPNPLNQARGLSPLMAGALTVDTSDQLITYQNSVIRNGGKIEGIINYKADNLTQTQIDAIRDSFQKQYATADKSGKPFVTYGGGEYQNLGLTPTELSYIDSLQMTRNDILMIYGVPKVIVAQTDQVNFANAKEGKAVFLSETIKPLLDNLVDKFNSSVLVDEEKEILGYIDPTPADVELRNTTLETASKVGAISTNEKREMLGLEPVEDSCADDIIAPINLAPLCDDDNQDNTKFIKVANTKKKSKHPLKRKRTREKYGRMWLRAISKDEKAMLKKLRAYFNNQEKRVLEGLRKFASLKQTPDNEMFNKVFNFEEETAIAFAAFLPLMTRFFKRSGQETFDFLDLGQSFVLSVTDKTTIEQRAEFFADQINNTTVEQLQKEFNKSIAEGETIKQLSDRIKGKYDEISEGRATVIARTETQVANQTGKFSAYKKANIPTKIWVWAPGVKGGVRDWHMAMDGEERPIDQPFSNGLMFPGDPSGGAEEVVNCQCSI